MVLFRIFITVLARYSRLLRRPVETFQHRGTPLSLTLAVAGQPILVELKPGQHIILGRRKADDDTEHLIDLSRYQALEHGVSRHHAIIAYGRVKADFPDLWVKDLETPNGTYLNGHRLPPHTLTLLRHTDELRLGQLRVSVYYEIVLPRLEWIRLYNPSLNIKWETNGATWSAALALARFYGWQPSLSSSDTIDPQGLPVSEAEAKELADALERALPHLALDAPRAIAKLLNVPSNEPPSQHFGGEVGEQKLDDLIAFCRRGAFRIMSL